jgi:hypothetical protein
MRPWSKPKPKTKRHGNDDAELVEHPLDAEGERLRLEHDRAVAEYDAARPGLDVDERRAERNLAAARASGSGVEAAKAALAEVQERRATLIARKEAAAEKVTAHGLTSRENEQQAARERKEAAVAKVTNLVPRIQDAAIVMEKLAEEARGAADEYEAAHPEVPAVIGHRGTAGPIMGIRREGFDERVAVILGAGDPQNAVSWIINLFRRDPRAPHGGPLARWRSLAEEAGLLPVTIETRARLDAERQRKADALVQNALADERTRAHLARVWGDYDARIIPGGMK